MGKKKTKGGTDDYDQALRVRYMSHAGNNSKAGIGFRVARNNQEDLMRADELFASSQVRACLVVSAVSDDPQNEPILELDGKKLLEDAETALAIVGDIHGYRCTDKHFTSRVTMPNSPETAAKLAEISGCEGALLLTRIGEAQSSGGDDDGKEGLL